MEKIFGCRDVFRLEGGGLEFTEENMFWKELNVGLPMFWPMLNG